ncbi:FAD-dependent oxidoreductase [Portibacter marinus]|uniref:FAD-dependent oxidoreductase n=1 Tax=Portibacter marinus TaxID=2898660 RepID=UPI001F425308|nr:FAD-dependent oxidoreductase [Portibacter marinus]
MIVIIGGGISGLVAAINFESAGKECLIVEKSSMVGGRVATDHFENIPFDHGFQVLLTDYPEAKKYLNYQELDLQKFDSGAVIFKNGKKSQFGDPLRNLSHLFPTIFSWVGNFSDKLKVYRLSTALKIKTVKNIFESSEKTTMQYLKDYGFSDQIISNFFQPFFGGIFLESKLETSSRMFEFVFKMFANGYAAIPRKGMEAIPLQLKSQLRKTKFVTGMDAEVQKDGLVKLGNGRTIKADGIIIAYANQSLNRKGCSTFYFEVKNRILENQVIGLLAESNTITNSFHYLSDHILSVTTLGNDSDRNITDQEIRSELHKYCGIEVDKLIKRYDIPQSLPVLKNIGEGNRADLKIIGDVPVTHAGDHLYYGSLNAAMYSGEVAAQTLLDYFSSPT